MVNDSSHSLEPPRCLPTLSTLRTPGRLKGQPGRSSYYFPREDGSLSIRLIARVERLIARGIWLAGEMFISIRLLMLPTLFFALKRTGPGSHMRNPLRPNSGVGVFIQNQAARLVIPGTPLSSPDWSGLDFRGCLWISPACWPRPVTARKDDAPAAVQAAIANVVGLGSASGGGGLIQTTSG